MTTHNPNPVRTATDEAASRSLIRAYGFVKQVMEPYGARYGISGSQWDILQDIMMSVYLKLHALEYRSAFSTWVHRITLNVFLIHEQKQKHQPPLFIEE